MKETLTQIIKDLIEHKEELEITETPEERGMVYHIKVNNEDIGRLIGRQGKTINALRTIFKAAGLKQGQYVRIELVEEPKEDSAEDLTNTSPIESEEVTA